LPLYKPAKIVAELGCNHKGEFELAKELIKVAAMFSKVDVVKFQKRNVRETLTEDEYNSPHPEPRNSFGKTYGEHREFLEFNLDQHAQLKEVAESFGVGYSSSVWDPTSAKEIVSLDPAYIKVPSACNTNFGLLSYLTEFYRGDVHVSLGMTTRDEEKAIVDFFRDRHALNRLVLYSCTSGYPVPYEDVALLEISRLKEAYSKEIAEIGFSGHHKGIAVDYAAYTLGATYIERHFTLDRTWKGTDHAASLEPDGMRRIVENIKDLRLALDFKKKEILDIEETQRRKLKWNRGATLPVVEGLSEVNNAMPLEQVPKKRKKIRLLAVDVDGTLTDGGMYYDQSGNELKKFNTVDGKGIELLREDGIRVLLITGENSAIVEKRAQKLRVDHLIQASTDKLTDLMRFADQERIGLDETAYLGDDVNDLEAIKRVGFSCCPANAHRLVRNAVDYVCVAQGGKGAVREVCDLIRDKQVERK